MSSLISSFIIEPVVRQARRFSNAPVAEAPVQARKSQSHASDATPADAFITAHRAAPAIVSEGQGLGHGLGHEGVGVQSGTDASAPTTTTPRRLDVHGEALTPPLSHDQYSSVATSVEHAASPATAAVTSSVEDVVAAEDEEGMASNPFGAATMAEGGSPPPSPRLSRSSTVRRTTTARDIPRPALLPREGAQSSQSLPSSLPADDGMRLLRQRIHQIRELAETPEDKARRMHDLMTAEWQAAQASWRPQSPASITSQDRPCLASSPLSVSVTPHSPLSTSSLPVDLQNPYQLQPEDYLPTYRPFSADSLTDEDITPPIPSLGCKHYKRNVKIQCFDCKQWYPCRHCHDAEQHSHHLNRPATENMLCMLCYTPQPASQWCRGCGERGAWYYCDICKLWDDDSTKSIYHCQDCGICRRGEGIGKDFIHCKKCNVCISISHYPTHTCIENATDSNCPLCLDYMFTSPHEIVAMPCGHYLHHHCYSQLMLSSYQCPICKRSAVNMETQWRKLDEEIRRQPMPREFSDARMEVKCNDCGARSIVGFHWLGCRCGTCDGFNTVEVRMIADGAVRRDVEDFAVQRRERREVEQRNWARDPLSMGAPRRVNQPLSVRPYFQQMDETTLERPSSARSGDSTFGMPSLPQLPNLNPYVMLARVSRGLSPIRHYFDGEIIDAVPTRFRAGVGGETEPEWVDEGDWWVDSDASSSEEESDDGSGSEEDDSDEEFAREVDDDEGDGEGELDFTLFGHR